MDSLTASVSTFTYIVKLSKIESKAKVVEKIKTFH